MSRSLALRRPTRTELAVAAMALLLGVLAVLQYRWVGQLSADERERLRSHADNQAENLTEEFNRELTRAFFWLQVGPELQRDAPLDDEVESLRALVLGGAAARAGQDDLSPDRADDARRARGSWSGSPAIRPGSTWWRGRPSWIRSAPSWRRRARRTVPAPSRSRLVPTFAIGSGPPDPAHRAAEGSRRRPDPQRVAAERLHRRGARSRLSREGSAAAARRAPLPAVAGSERLRRDLRPGHRLQRARRRGAGGVADGAGRHRRRHVRDPVLRVPAVRHRSPARAARRHDGRRGHDRRPRPGPRAARPRRPGRTP